jgi:F-box interacting protein
MNLPPPKLQLRPKAASLPIILPDELIIEVLSFLPVKSLMRLKCVSKSWKTLISNSFFIKLHLQRSIRKPQLAIVYIDKQYIEGRSVLPISLSCLLESSSITLTDDPYYQLKDKNCHEVVGSCNGLLCLLGHSYTCKLMWLCFWNPATRTISNTLGYRSTVSFDPFEFTFGYDDSTDTYKVVALQEGKVFSLGDNVWKNIQSFPVNYKHLNKGVHLSGSINWLTLHNYDRRSYNSKYISVEQFLIISLDLRTETYKELRLPQGFDDVPLIQPSLCVLMDCLCFSNVVKVTHFVIWKMTEYGVEESWTQLLEINLQIIYRKLGIIIHFRWMPLHVSKNCDTLILANCFQDLLLYNLRHDSVERARITNRKYKSQEDHITNHAESLVLSY